MHWNPVRPPWTTRLAGVLAVLMVLLTAWMSPARAADQVELTLTTPRLPAVISGVTYVGFSATTGAPVLESATVTIRSGSSEVSASQDVDRDWCRVACLIEAELDISALSDGPGTITLTAQLIDGSTVTKENPVSVQNGPTVHVGYEVESGRLAVDATAVILAYAEPHAGASITSVTWRGPSGAVVLAPYDEPNLLGANYRAVVDTSGLSEGPHVGYLTATDSAGRTGPSLPVTLWVIRTIALTPIDPPTGQVGDLALRELKVRYAYDRAVTTAYPVSATIEVDGVQVDRSRVIIPDEAYDTNAGVATVESAYRLSGGPHVVTLNLTDNRGVLRSLRFDVVVVPAIQARWISGAGATVVSGDLHTLTARVVSRGPLDLGCQVGTEERRELQPVECTRQQDGSYLAKAVVQLYTDGPKQTKLYLGADTGSPVVLETTLTVIPRMTATIIEAEPVAVGKKARFVGEIRSSQRIYNRVGVDLQTRKDTKSPWQTVGRATSTATQPGLRPLVRISVVVQRTGDYRMVTRALKGKWGGSVGPERRYKIASTVRVTSRPSTVRKGTTSVIKATTRPGTATLG